MPKCARFSGVATTAGGLTNPRCARMGLSSLRRTSTPAAAGVSSRSEQQPGVYTGLRRLGTNRSLELKSWRGCCVEPISAVA